MPQGFFITFEGIDGCGKTTQLLHAKEALAASGRECIATREPGGTQIGEKIRDLLLSPSHGNMHDECELLLYCAARAQLVRETILPALERGDVVLCDRFAEATFAYQGYGRGLPLEVLEKVNAFAASQLSPSLTFVFDIDVAISMERIGKSGKTVDRLEGSGRVFYENVRQGYLDLARRHPGRIVVIGGDAPVGAIAEEVRKRIFSLVNA
jgi:dTMP kinase